MNSRCGRLCALVRCGLAAATLCLALGSARAGEPVVMGWLHARNPKGLAEKVGKLAEKIVPERGAQAVASVAAFMDSPRWAGVDWTRPAAIGLFAGHAFAKTQPVPVAIVTVADAVKFEQARKAVADAKLHFVVRDGLALLSEDEAALAAVTPEQLAAWTQLPETAADSDVYAAFHVARAIQAYQAEIDEWLREAVAGFGGPNAAGPMAFMAQLARAAGPLITLASRQYDRAALALRFNDDSVDIWGPDHPVAGSELGAFFAGQPAGATDLVKHLPRDAVFSVGANLDFEKAKPLVDVILKAVAEPLKLSPDDQTALRRLIFASTQTGEAAMAFVGGPQHQGIQSVQVLRIIDGAEYRAATKEAMGWFAKTGFGDMMKGFGLEMHADYQPGAREHKGVVVDRVTVRFAPAPEAAPNPAMGQLPAQVTEITTIGEIGLATSNNAAGDLLDTLIDRVQDGAGQGLDTAPGYKAAQAAAPKDANVVSHILLNSVLAKYVEQITKQQPAIGLLFGGLFKADPTEQPITWWYRFGKGRGDFGMRIPHQPVVDLATRIRTMIEQHRAREDDGIPEKDADF